MKKLLSFLLVLVICFSFSGCENSKIEYETDLVGLEEWNYYYEGANIILLLENKMVTEYVCKSDKSTFNGEKTCIAKPNEKIYWDYYIEWNKERGGCDYISITAKNNGKIVGYAVVKVTITVEQIFTSSGYLHSLESDMTATIVKSVRFDDASIEKGITQIYVNRAMRKCKNQ